MLTPKSHSEPFLRLVRQTSLNPYPEIKNLLGSGGSCNITSELPTSSPFRTCVRTDALRPCERLGCV